MRVLFSSTAGDGHLLPLLPLAQAFARRGAEVVVAAPVSQGDRIEDAGLRHEPAGPTLAEVKDEQLAVRAHVRTLPIPERRTYAFAHRFGEIETARRLPAMRTLVERLGPDVVVHDPAELAAPIAAAAAGRPSVTHSFGLPIPGAAVRAAAAVVAPLWESAGLEPDPWAGVFRSGYVDICPPSFTEPLADAPAWFSRLRPHDATDGTNDERRVVYVTLGTVFNNVATFRLLLDAFAGIDARIVMTTGADIDPAELGAVPANAHVKRYVAQAEILRECTAVVSHGGSGSTLGALAYGRPLVLVPAGADQFDNARACAALGVGEVVLPDDLTVDAARSALSAVLEDLAYTEAAERVAAEIAAMPGADEVAASLETWARTSAG